MSINYNMNNNINDLTNEELKAMQAKISLALYNRRETEKNKAIEAFREALENLYKVGVVPIYTSTYLKQDVVMKNPDAIVFMDKED